MKKLFLCTSMLLGLQAVAPAQDIDVTGLFEAGLEDSKRYLQAYLRPMGEGLIAGSSGGWVSTGATHHILGFEIKASVSGAMVPTGKELFSFAGQGFERMVINDMENDLFPTMIGSSEMGPNFQILGEDGQELTQMQGLRGLGLLENHDLEHTFVPVPSLQAGIGLDKGTDVKIRYIPGFSESGVSVKSFGVGIQHDIMQHFDKGNFDLSILVAYNGMELNYNVGEMEEQVLQANINSLTGQAILSKRLAILTLFATAGYNTGHVGFDLKGEYTNSNGDTFQDPLHIAYSLANPFASIGSRLRIGPAFVSAEYTLQKYNMFTLGAGISIAERKSNVRKNRKQQE